MRRNMSLLENIFSVKNSDLDHKQICIMGLKIKWYREAKVNNAYENLPIENNKIVFFTFLGAYTCNPKYIAEEILRQQLPYDLVWVVDKHILKYINDFPKNIRLVMAKSPESYLERATAKIWISNKRELSYVKRGLFKRDNQIYIQTWHGSLGIKKTAPDRKDRPKRALTNSKIDSSQIDYLISNGTYTSDFFRRIFWNNGKILETGHPRNDVFFKDDTKIKEKVYSSLNISKDKKIVMYAPTFREDFSLDFYNINCSSLIQALNKKFEQEYVFVLRLHPKLINLKYLFKQKYENDSMIDVIDATDYNDMQELLVASDIVITDYSSCIYDFMLSYKPAFIFATDIKKYDNGRGLYYPLTSTPFPVAENNDEFVKNIENFNYEKYKKEVKNFLDEKGCIEDGHASERVVDLIKSIINNAQQTKQEEITA